MPARRKRSPYLTAVPAVVLALALAGCGGGGDDEEWTPSRPNGTFSPGSASAGSEPAASAAATGSAAPVESAKGVSVTGASLAQRINSAIAAKKTASFTILGTGPQPMSADGLTSGTGSGLQLKMNATISAMSKVQIIRQGGVVYLRPPTPMTPDKAWLKITDDKKDPFRQFYTTLFSSLETSGDVGATAGVIGQIPSLTAAGNESVDGVPCIKYVAKPSGIIGAKLMPASYQQLGDTTLKQSRSEVSVWVDSTGLIHRVATTLTLPKTTSDQTAKSLVTYKDWGKSVAITPPPASQVASGTKPS